MKEKNNIQRVDALTTRRKFLAQATGLIGAGLTLAATTSQGAGTCALTPAQPKGPFYPTGREPLTGFTKDNDLTWVENATGNPLGTIFDLDGVVTDEACSPIDGALVEIWQACASGRYNHEHDPNTAALDPNFQYYGKFTTGPDGRYSFRTVKPGAYPADVDWMRPPHIHFRVMKRGFTELISQMYFDGEAYNDSDLILQGVPPQERAALIVKLQVDPLNPLNQKATWNLTLKRPIR